MIPLMTSRLGLSQHIAHGTSLFAVAATGLAGSVGYTFGSTCVIEHGSDGGSASDASSTSNKDGEKQGKLLPTSSDPERSSSLVDVPVATVVALTGMLSARHGAAFSSKLNSKNLKRALGYFMIGISPTMPLKPYLLGTSSEEDGTESKNDGDDVTKSSLASLLIPASIGAISGFASGLFGIGGGSILVPSLSIFTPLSHSQSLATSLCAMVLPAAIGTVSHYQKGNVCLRIGVPLAVGCAAGAYGGGGLVAGGGVNEEVLRYGFGVLMFVLGAKSVRK